MARRVADARTEAYALTWHFLVIDTFDAPSGYERWLEEIKEVVEALLTSAKAANDPEMQRAAHFTAIISTMYEGDIAAGRGHLREHEALSTKSRIPQDMHVTSYAGAALALLAGKHDEAERLMEEARAFAERTPGATQTSLVQLYALRLQQGRLPEIEGVLRAVRSAEPRARVFAAHFASETGDVSWAQSEFEDVLASDDAEAPEAFDRTVVLILGPDVCHRLNDTVKAERLYRDILPWRAINFGFGCFFYTGSASRQLGVLAETLGRYDDAQRHFEDALAMNTRMGARPWLARTQLDYARMLLVRNNHGDRARGGELLHPALETAREIGMAKVAADCERLLASIG
jgi:tetratricopeptide (TPR) repeat protein